MWAEARRTTKHFLIVTITLSTLAGVMVVLQAGFLARIIDVAFLRSAPLADLADWYAALVLVIIVRAVLAWGAAFTAGEMTVRLKQSLRQRAMARITELGPAFTAGERSGELTLGMTEGIEALDAYFREYLPGIVTAAILPILYLLVMAPIDGLTFVVMLITAPLIPLFMVLIGKAAGALARSQYSEMAFLSAHFVDVMQGLPTLKLFNRSLFQIETIGRITEQFREATMKVLRVAFLSAFTLEMLATVSVAIVAVEIGLRLLNGTLGFEPALFLLILAPDYYQPLRTLGARFHSGTEGQAAATRLYAILDTPAQGNDLSGTLPVPTKPTIRFENVTVDYDGRSALNGLTLEIPPGKLTAIVGASGSGKSTLAALLLRFIDPTEGKITLNSSVITSVNVEAWRSQIAWVGQNPYLFNTSVAENIRLGHPDASMDALITAAKKAEAHDFVQELAQGYDTPCGERGANLSGGQAQRIGLARVFLRDAPLFILDEATTQLDSRTEARIMATLRQMNDKTRIVIAHRLRSIMQADLIVVMERGRVVEQGTHEALMAHNGVYHHMVSQDET